MKVFLSWSGNKSHKVALVFRDWFPSVIQCLELYVSSEDIDMGDRWSIDIAKELEDSFFGILCVTRDNLTAPWLIFEAGALSKTIDKSFVCPFLFDIKKSEVDGPLLQFQSAIFNRDDVFKIVKTLNKACGENQLSDKLLEDSFFLWYPKLEEKLDNLESKRDENQDTITFDDRTEDSNEVLEEILDLSRLNQKLIRNPESTWSKKIFRIDENLEQVMLEIETLRDQSNVQPNMYRSFEHIVPSLEKILNNNIDDAIFQAELKINLLGICFYKSFPFIKDFVEKNCMSGKRIEIRLSMLDRGFIENSKLGEQWKIYYDVYQSQLDDFCKRVNKTKNANVSLKICKYSYMPNLHGILINKKHLFMGECFLDSENNLRTDGNYALYEKGMSLQQDQKIIQFIRWFNYGRFNGTVEPKEQLIFDTSK